LLDGENKVIHAEMVDEIGHEPDYDAAIKALRAG
jgi:thiol peroxidase